jgi:hypothetical protein
VYAANAETGHGGRSVAARLRDRLVAKHQLTPSDNLGVLQVILAERDRLAPGRPALRADTVAALASHDPEALGRHLRDLSPAARMRNGVDYFEAFFAFAHAAGVPHVFVFVDQLEDLANSATPRAKREKEVGRIRDLACEHPMFAGKVHLIFTMHGRAQHAVQELWMRARLPRFDRSPVTEEYVVTLEGIRDDAQVAELLHTFLRPLRPDGGDNLLPFDTSALAALRTARAGRVGPILELARISFDAAARRNVHTVDAALVRALDDGSATPTDQAARRRGTRARDARVIDDVLT